MTPLTKFSIDIFSDIKIDNHVTIVLIFSREISKGVYFMVGIYNEIWKKWIDKEFVKKEISPIEKSIEKTVSKETVETVKDAKGKRQYSIRRKVVPK